MHMSGQNETFRPSFSTHRRRLYSNRDTRKGLRPLRRDAAHIDVTVYWLCPFLSLSSLICIFRDRHTACHWTRDLYCFEALRRDLEGSLGCSLTLIDNEELFLAMLNADEEPLPALHARGFSFFWQLHSPDLCQWIGAKSKTWFETLANTDPDRSRSPLIALHFSHMT